MPDRLSARQSFDKDIAYLGWTCAYTPEEVIYAAGLQPFRLLEFTSPLKLADTYFHANICPYVRNCLDFALRDQDPSFRGMVIVNSCDAMRSLYNSLLHYNTAKRFIHLIDLPKIASTSALNFFAGEIRKLISALEKHFECSITDSSLNKAIDVYNETRDLMDEVYRLRQNERINISETQFYDIVRETQTRPREITNLMLKELVAESKTQSTEIQNAKKPRIMIVGSILTNSELMEIIEDAGAKIVWDDLCLGRRYYEGRVEKGGDPVNALSRCYLLKSPCSRMKDTNRRLEMTKKQVEDYRIDGIIYNTIKFCDNDMYDFSLYRKFFQNIDVPILQIEDTGFGGNLGQKKIRIEAFIEMLWE